MRTRRLHVSDRRAPNFVELRTHQSGTARLKHLGPDMSLKLTSEELERDVSPLSERRSSLPTHSDSGMLPGALESPPPEPRPTKWSAMYHVVMSPIGQLHRKTPFLKRLPAYVLLPITILILVNCAVWAIVGIILRYHPYPNVRCS